jgi:DNA-binding Xre family transcriptional regulator
MTIGEAVRMRILELCKENLITVNGLSLKCGITQSTLSNLVLGKNKNLQINTIKKICDGLEITIQDFFNSPIFDDLEQEIK